MADSRFKEFENNEAPVKCGTAWANIDQGAGQASKNGNRALKRASWNGRDPIASITTRIGKQGVIGT